MILFLGDYEHQYYIEEPARELGETIQGSGQNLYHADAVSDACMSHDGCSTIVINIEAMTDIPQDIGDALEAVREETGAVIVIIDIGASLSSSVIGYLYRRGFRNFITSSVMGVAKEQARQALRNEGTTVDTGEAESSRDDDWLSDEDYDPDLEEDDNGQALFRTRKEAARIIAVAGCGHRLGTTTHAIQSAVFLETFHKHVAYFEHNESGFVDALMDQKHLEFSNSDLGMTDFQTVHLIRNGFDFRTLEPKEYDSVILDCGSIYDPQFDKKAFLDSDVQIVVFGCKPGEGRDLAEAFAKSAVHSMFYICSSAPTDEQVEIMSGFGDCASHVFFAPYVPDPFEYEEDAAPMIARILKKRGEPYEDEWKKELVSGTRHHWPVRHRNQARTESEPEKLMLFRTKPEPVRERMRSIRPMIPRTAGTRLI